MPRRASSRGPCRHVTIWKAFGLLILVGVSLLAANGWGNSPLFGYDASRHALWSPIARPGKDDVAILSAPLAFPAGAAAGGAAPSAAAERQAGAPPTAEAARRVSEVEQPEASAAPAPAPTSPPAPPPTTAAEAEIKGEPQWIFCAGQWQDCWCGGRVRWGNRGNWKVVELPAGKSEQQIMCSIDKLGDPAWGDGGKHCECEVDPGTDFGNSVNPGLLPTNYAKPFSSCDMFKAEQGSGEWATVQWSAIQPFCDPEWDESSVDNAKAGRRAFSLKEMQHLMNSYVDPRFTAVHEKYFGKTGWAQRAFVNYYAGPPSGKHAAMTEQLVVSVHEFSNEPIVVFHFGLATPKTWNAKKFPRLVLVHAAPMSGNSGRSFNFNKLRAMMLSRALVGIQLDSDQFVAPNVDDMFKTTEREVTKDYAMPILPAHFLDRGPRDLGAYWARYCPKDNCKWQTSRWGHAHPTWTFWAVTWISRWLRRNFRDETLPVKQGGSMQALRVVSIPEDEDLLNIATWEEGGTKQWCKLDLPGPGDFEALLRSNADSARCKYNCGDITSDAKWHPKAVAKAFYTAHHAVDPKESARYIKALKAKRDAGDLPPPIMYKGKFFKDGDALRAEHPDITCII